LRGHRVRKACPLVARPPLIAPLTLTFTQLPWFVVPTFLTRFDVLQLPASYFRAGALAFMHCAQYLWVTVTTHYARAAGALTRLANLQASQGRAAEAADTRSLAEQTAAAFSSNPGSTRNPDR
jgi:hypothetical protein